MVEGVEAAGDAIAGGLAARAVEPASGGAGACHDGACLNCGTRLIGPHCHSCGQSAHVHRTMGAFFHDLAHGVLHVDGKLWRTLPLLVWRPGELTRRYASGERARFLSPLALFLFSVFLMLAAINLFGGPFGAAGVSEGQRAEARREFAEARAESLARIDALKRERAADAARGAPTAAVDRKITEIQRDMAAEDVVYREAMRVLGAQEKETARVRDDYDFKSGLAALDRGLRKARANPDLIIYKLQSNAYKYSWALIPISVPFLSLLFLHRRRYWHYGAYDHVVFVTYSIAFMSLGFVALTVLTPLGLPESISGLAIAFVPPVHMYRQLRGAYLLSRFSAAWRTAALIIFAFTASSLFLGLVVALGMG